MRFPNKETVERIRRDYPAGSRVELVRMDDVQAPPIGTRGTVRGVDDIGSIMVSWDTGSSLSVAYGEDIVKKLDAVTTICYGERKIWDSRKEAVDFFLQGIAATEGSECQRYTAIYTKLIMGCEVCSDDED